MVGVGAKQLTFRIQHQNQIRSDALRVMLRGGEHRRRVTRRDGLTEPKVGSQHGDAARKLACAKPLARESKVELAVRYAVGSR